MFKLSLYAFVCSWLVTVVEASYSNCPKVSVAVETTSNSRRSGCRFREYLRARLPEKNFPSFAVNSMHMNPRRLDAGGKKRFSKRTAFFFYSHKQPGTTKQFISIHLAKHPSYTLAEEKGQLWFLNVTNPQSTIPEDKFLFKRVISPKWQTLQSKLSKRYISFAKTNCSVFLKSEKDNRHNLFNVKCEPDVPGTRCLCFSN